MVLEAFHAAHEMLFAVRDEGSEVEVVGWGATVACQVKGASRQLLPNAALRATGAPRTRKAWFDPVGHVDADCGRWHVFVLGAWERVLDCQEIWYPSVDDCVEQ